jgi:hypothetical protein
MTTSLPAESQGHEQNGFWSIRLTRTTACLMSIFGPALLFIPLVLVIEAMEEMPRELAGDGIGSFAILCFGVAAVGMRFYFASWYARQGTQ